VYFFHKFPKIREVKVILDVLNGVPHEEILIEAAERGIDPIFGMESV
jgi:hypothetical protein